MKILKPKILNLFKNKKTNNIVDNEPTFKVDLGNGIETVTWSRLNNLSQDELDYIYKNVKHCTGFSGEIPNDLLKESENVKSLTDCFEKPTSLMDLPNDLFKYYENCTELKSLSSMDNKQREFCFKNKIEFHEYPLIGLAAIIDSKFKPEFNLLNN